MCAELEAVVPVQEGCDVRAVSTRGVGGDWEAVGDVSTRSQINPGGVPLVDVFHQACVIVELHGIGVDGVVPKGDGLVGESKVRKADVVDQRSVVVVFCQLQDRRRW